MKGTITATSMPELRRENPKQTEAIYLKNTSESSEVYPRSARSV